jgi:hypothetical protein
LTNIEVSLDIGTFLNLPLPFLPGNLFISANLKQIRNNISKRMISWHSKGMSRNLSNIAHKAKTCKYTFCFLTLILYQPRILYMFSNLIQGEYIRIFCLTSNRSNIRYLSKVVLYKLTKQVANNARHGAGFINIIFYWHVGES